MGEITAGRIVFGELGEVTDTFMESVAIFSQGEESTE